MDFEKERALRLLANPPGGDHPRGDHARGNHARGDRAGGDQARRAGGAAPGASGG
jgi:hypothetical protein